MKVMKIVTICFICYLLTACSKYNTVSIPVKMDKQAFNQTDFHDDLNRYLHLLGYPKIRFVISLDNERLNINIPQKTKYAKDEELINYLKEFLSFPDNSSNITVKFNDELKEANDDLLTALQGKNYLHNTISGEPQAMLYGEQFSSNATCFIDLKLSTLFPSLERKSEHPRAFSYILEQVDYKVLFAFNDVFSKYPLKIVKSFSGTIVDGQKMYQSSLRINLGELKNVETTTDYTLTGQPIENTTSDENFKRCFNKIKTFTAEERGLILNRRFPIYATGLANFTVEKS